MDELIGTQEVPVIAGTTVLDDQSCTRLLQMLKSTDEGDHKIAQLILNQVNIQHSIYWIWYLSRRGWSVGQNMVNLRTKASRKFRDDSSLFSLSNMNESEFINHLNTKSWLTPEIFQKLMSQVHRDIVFKIKGITCSKFYNYTMELKPEYKHLDPSDHLKEVAYDTNK
jgi:hypothetical protein